MRTISPHKGGRTTQVHARLTPEEKAQLEAELRRVGMSLSDWIMKHIPARAGEERMMSGLVERMMNGDATAELRQFVQANVPCMPKSIPIMTQSGVVVSFKGMGNCGPIIHVEKSEWGQDEIRIINGWSGFHVSFTLERAILAAIQECE